MKSINNLNAPLCMQIIVGFIILFFYGTSILFYLESSFPARCASASLLLGGIFYTIIAFHSGLFSLPVKIKTLLRI